MNQKTIKLLSLLLIISSFVLFEQCREDQQTYWVEDAPVIGVTYVHGTVVDANRMPLAGVQVKDLANKTAVTDQNGFFELENAAVIRGRLMLEAQQNGYFNKSYALATNQEHTTLQVMMSSKNTQMVSAASPALIEMEAASVSLPDNGFVDESGNAYTGMVEVAFTHYNPTDDYFELLMPGGDFEGVRENDEEVLLLSYGAMSVELQDEAGNELQLAEGETATLRFTVPSDMLADAPATIPLWYFDEAVGRWIEEGFATLTGNEYIGTVSHFSAWNIDVPLDDRTWLEGQIVDCNGAPVPNIGVTVGPLLVYTNENGNFGTNVALGYEFSVYIGSSYNFGLTSEVIEVEAFNENEALNLGQIAIPCPAYISGSITDCDGNTSAGTVVATWANNSKVQYSGDGNFTMVVAQDVEISLQASANIDGTVLLGESSITSTAAAEVSLTEPIALCNEFNIECPGVGFILDGTPIIFDEENLSYTIDDTLNIAPLTGLNDVMLEHLAIHITDNYHRLSIIVPDTVPNIYDIAVDGYTDGILALLLDIPSVGIIYENADGSVSAIGFAGIINLTVVGPDYISGTFNATGNNGGGSTTINMTEGTFCIPYNP